MTVTVIRALSPRLFAELDRWGLEAVAQRSPQRPLGRRYRVRPSGVHRQGRAERAGQCLEAALRDVVVVLAVEVGDVQGDAGVLREGVEPLAEQLGVHRADLVPREAHLPDEIGP